MIGRNQKFATVYRRKTGLREVTEFVSCLSNTGEMTPIPPVAPASILEDAMDIVVCRLDLAPEAISALEVLLSDAERQRADRFVFDRDRRRFIVARARLRELLAKRLGMEPESVELEYGTHGKPALARRRPGPDLRFNVSHSEDVAVYAFSWGRATGIDVEVVRVIRDADKIAARFFSHCENEAYRALDARDRPLGFFNCWTRKEAFIKAIGDGLYHPLDCFDVSLTPGEPAKILRVEGESGDHCGWCLDSFSPAPGFVAAVATENRKRHVDYAAFLPRRARPATMP
jgi:4'-phosphopantetheinyl transferase